jgi:alpha-D-xyloside xylohydrolase
MKFTNGYWLIREGVTPHYPSALFDATVEGKTLSLYSPFKKVEGRADMLDTGMLTVSLSSPSSDVIRVRILHHSGGRRRGPEFAIAEESSFEPRIGDDGTAATFTSGKLSARACRGQSWKMEFFAGGEPLTSSGFRAMAYIQAPEGKFMREELSLGVGETVYGLGERFSALVKNRQSVDVWNSDGGTGSEQTYKNIPFYLTNRGYGIFVNSPGRVGFEVASEKNSRVQFSVKGEVLEYFVIYGPSPKEILTKYTALTGRPALVPEWSFGLWLTTSFTTSYDEKTVTGIIQSMAERDLPLHVFHFDAFWMREYDWVDLQWDKRIFPDPEAMLARLKARGLHVCVWMNPYIAQRSRLFAEAVGRGYLLKRPDGDVWQWDLWQPGMGIVDFTNPAAREWFCSYLRHLIDMGVDSFKTDFGERIPTDVVYHDGSDPELMHNYFTFLYNKTVFECLKEKRGGEAVVFARSATAGGQCFPVHWGGDSESTFESMAESLRGGLSLSMSGFGFWSHDIGGFEGMPRAEVYKRWIAFGLLSSHSRLHGSSSYRVPWLFDEEAVEVLRKFTKLKCSLMPYIFAAAVEASTSGLPVMRSMLLEFPEDPGVAYLDRQYLLGDALLVAPVFCGEGDIEYYLPAGRWTNYLTGKVVDSGPRGSWQKEKWDFFGLPLMARPGSVIASGGREDRPDYDYTEDLTLHAFELPDRAAVTTVVPAADGSVAASFETTRSGSTIRVERKHSSKGWNLLLENVFKAELVSGLSLERTDRGVLLRADASSDSIVARLPD